MSSTLEDQINELRRAIAELDTQRSVMGDGVVDASLAPLRQKLAELEAQKEPSKEKLPEIPTRQRKLVTMLYMDVVGSTAMTQHLDPEDTLEIMDDALPRLAAPIEAHGGHVTRYTGDGFKAVFGDPFSREDDPEQAIRAGLDILGLAKDIAQEVETEWGIEGFQVRIGIDTGLAALGGRTEAEDTVMGRVVNLAVRIEGAAPPGGLLISHNTYRHVRGVFNVEPQEPIMAKGFPRPVPVYLVNEIKPRAFRVLTRGVEGVETHMVGRHDELKHLQDALLTAIEEGEGGIVTISGEAGVGKSRLLYEFDNWIELLPPPDVRFFQGRGRPEAQGQPYSLLRDLFSFRFQILEDDSSGQLHRKIESGFGEVFGEIEDALMRAHLIGQLLGFDFNASPHLESMSTDPEQLRDRGLLYLKEYFQTLSHESPIVIFLEDIHWGDNSSLDVVNQLGELAQHLRLLIVCATRPVLFERRPYWGEGWVFHTQLELRPLSRRESRHLVSEILKLAEEVPTELRELVVAGAEGNPFYVEELIKMLIENGVVVPDEENWHIELTRLENVDVPSTLTGVLQARLDSLPIHERTVLQQASVVGRLFWDSIVAYIQTEGGISGDTQLIPQALNSLRRRELVYRHEESAFVGAVEYLFKHDVLREVTYESVIKRLRKTYHALVAEWLINKSKGRESEFVGEIADHLELAEKREQAAIYLYQAGVGAAQRYANSEALEYLNRALSLTPDHDLVGRFDLLLAREGVLNLIGDRVAQEQDLNSLKQIAESIGDVKRQADTALRRLIYLVEISYYEEAEERAADAISLAHAAMDLHCEAKINLHWGRSLWHHGKSLQAIAPLETALQLAQSHHFQEIEAEVLRNLGVVYRNLGDSDRFLRLTQQALIKYRESGNLKSEAAALNNLGIFFDEDDFNPELSKDYYEQSCEIARQIGDRTMEGNAIFNLGGVAEECQQFDLAIKHFQQSLRIAREVRDGFVLCGSMAWLGRCSSYQGEFDKASVIFDEVVQYSQQTGLKFGEIIMSMFLMDFYRTLGDFARAERFHQQFYDQWGEREFSVVETRALIWSGWLRFQMGEQQSAIRLSQQAIDSMDKCPKHVFRPEGLTVQGHILNALGRLQDAERAFQVAVKSAIDTHRPRFAMQARAGLAQTAMARAEFEQALSSIEQIISYLEAERSSYGHPFDGTLDPFRIYLTIYQILKANQDSRAPDILTEAHSLLQERAANISDEKLQHSFLSNIPANREIVQEFKLRKTI